MPAGKMAVFTIFPAVLLKNHLATLVTNYHTPRIKFQKSILILYSGSYPVFTA